jgi:hypothetical protein
MIIWTRNPLMFPQILPMDPIAVTQAAKRILQPLSPSPVLSPWRWRLR